MHGKRVKFKYSYQTSPLQCKEVVTELLYVVDYILMLLCDKKQKKENHVPEFYTATP